MLDVLSSIHLQDISTTFRGRFSFCNTNYTAKQMLSWRAEYIKATWQEEVSK